MIVIETNVISVLNSLINTYGNFRTRQEYGISAFWYWFYQIKNFINNMTSPRVRNGYNMQIQIPHWGKLTYSKFMIGTEPIIFVHMFTYSKRNLWLWLNHKSLRRPSYSVCDTCFGFSTVLFDNTQKYGIIRQDGNRLVKPVFDEIINFHHAIDDYNLIHAIGFIGDRVYSIRMDGDVVLLHMSKDDYLNLKHRYNEDLKRKLNRIITETLNRVIRESILAENRKRKVLG